MEFKFLISALIISLLSLTSSQVVGISNPSTVDIELTEKIEKNILVFCFPGGKSHNFVFKESFHYYKLRMEKENKPYKVKFHVIVHNFDFDLWKDTEHHVIGYGDIKSYEEHFFRAMEGAKEDPVLGYNSFNKAMIHIYADFLKDGILDTLRDTKFDLLLSDITNYLSVFLKTELKIPKQMYLNPTCIYTWINEVFEYNASYHPLIGSPHSEVMSFTQRFIDEFFLIGTRLMYIYFKHLQSAVFRENGFGYEVDVFPKDAVYLNQCVKGIHYSVSLPPNIICSGAILPKASLPLRKEGSNENEELDNFLSKHKRNIYVSQGTITKALRLEVLKEVFQNFPDVGFILSLKSEFHTEELSIADNVLLKHWVPQNDLLGDNRINAFITHGGLNSILESLYHAKPMIAIGTSIDQVNGAVLVNYRKYGIGLTKDKDITLDKFINSIDSVLNDPQFKQNCLVASNYVRETDGKDTFYYWLNYVLETGYEHLLIPALSDYSYIQLYNIDVGFAWLIILFVLYKLLKYLGSGLLIMAFKTKNKKE